MLKPFLDLKFARCCRRITLPSQWHMVDPNKTWQDFKNGSAEVCRLIRHRGKRYWVTAQMLEVDGFAKLFAFGLSGKLAKQYFVHFNLYGTDPREENLVSIGTLGGPGVVTKIEDVIHEYLVDERRKAARKA